MLKRKNLLTKILKWTGGTLGVILLLPVLIVVALYIPPVQNWAVHKAADIASEKTGMDISVGRVGISFPLDIDLQNVTVVETGDTLLHTGSVIVDLDFSNILDEQIGVDAIDIIDGNVNTKTLIAKTVIMGRLGLLHLDSRYIDLKNQNVNLTGAQLKDCDLDIAMRDTVVEEDTTKSVILWKLDVQNVNIENTRLAFHMPGDSIVVRTGISKAKLDGGHIDLGTSQYTIKDFLLAVDSVSMKMQEMNIHFPKTSLTVNDLYLDTTSVKIDNVQLQTEASSIGGKVAMDFTAFTPHETGKMLLDLKANIARKDIMGIAGSFIPDDLATTYPDRPINMIVRADGNIDKLNVDTMRMWIPEVIDFRADGTLENVMVTDSLKAQLVCDAQTMDLSFLKKYLNLSDINLPHMNINANINADGKNYKADAVLNEGRGNVHAIAMLNADAMAYKAKLAVNNLNLRHFLPKGGMGILSMSANVNGAGTDFLSPATRFSADMNVRQFDYEKYNINNLNLVAKLLRGKGEVTVTSCNDLLEGSVLARANIGKKISNMDLAVDLNSIDLYRLGITQDTLSIAMDLHADATTNLKDTHTLEAGVTDITIMTKDSIFHPLDMYAKGVMNPDTIHAEVDAGDLTLHFNSADGLDVMMKKINRFTSVLQKQMAVHELDQEKLRLLLPKLNLQLKSGNENPISNFIHTLGYNFEDLALNLDANPQVGLNGTGHIYKTNTGSVLLDTIQMNIFQDTTGMSMKARFKNGPKNKVVDFESIITAELTNNGARANMQFWNNKGEKGVDAGVEIVADDSTTTLHFQPTKQILAFRTFTFNEDNYISINKQMKVNADVDLVADDGTRIKMNSIPNDDALQDIDINLYKINLAELSSVVPFMPHLTGFLNGDVHYMQDTEHMTVSANVDANQLTYEGYPLGNLNVDVVYLPNNDGSHRVDALVSQNDREILSLSGKYWEEDGDGKISANANLERLPLDIANGFVPNGIIALEGYANGELSVSGSTSNPQMSGTLTTDSIHVLSPTYSLNISLPDDTITIDNNRLDLGTIYAYANGNNPIVLNGNVDASDLSNIRLNLGVRAENFNLMNAPQTRDAEAYGKVYVNILGKVTGTLNDLKVRGNLDILGNTNVTYVLKDAPVSVDNQLDDLVTFCDFSDTTEVENTDLQTQNLDMNIRVKIDQATVLHCLLNEGGTDKMDIEGGGDLTMTYDPLNGMRLYGRYTILSGNLNYSMVVVSLKNFKITEGSYVEFHGDPTQPVMDVSASEQVKSTVTQNDVPKTVTFDVGLSVSGTLEDMDLKFNISSPDDLATSTELSAMSEEDRARAAVTLLTTGMYLGNGSTSTGGFNSSNALNSFLQSQINSIAGKALNSVDIGFGMNDAKNSEGVSRTDYNFSFSKRFWGNRINVIIGGKVSSGKGAVNNGQSIVNNVSVEYRLDKSGTRYVKAFYNRDYESLLEGEITEMGAGIVLKKTTDNLGDLFIFINKKEKAKEEEMRKEAMKKEEEEGNLGN